MSYTNRNFTWDFDALKRFYERYIVKWLNSAVSWTEAQKKQARANLGFGDGDIDAEPTFGSNNLVQSGGVFNSVINSGVFDLSAHTGDSYVSLSAALTAMNALSAAYKKGGMSIKYIQSTDNKYVQYRLMATSFSTTVYDWQRISDLYIDLKNLKENLDFVDGNDRTFARFKKNGHLLMAGFDTQKWPSVEESNNDIEIADKNGNSAVEIENGEIITKNFNSKFICGSDSGRNGYGFITKANINDADYCFVPFYGQSFTVANDGGYKLTNIFDENVFMIGSSMIAAVSSSGNINPVDCENNSEATAIDAVSTISKLWKKYAHQPQDFIITSMGKGGTTISELSDDNGYYTSRFKAGINNVKSAVQAANKTFNCPCIIFLQGESDVNHGCNDNKEAYKAAFISLKNKMQADIMTATGQTEKPIVMIYTVGSATFSVEKYGIQNAQRELAEENNDVVCCGPYYQTPTMYHPSPDGRRWLGEIIAKCYYESLMIGIDNFMRPEFVQRKKNLVAIHVKNAVLPLVIDRTTVVDRVNCGFRVFVSGIEMPISEVFIRGNIIYIRLAGSLDYYQNVVVAYGDEYGGGNIRDSEEWVSYWTYASNEAGNSSGIIYIPKWKDGTTMIGHNYIMSKWLPMFSLSI